jgi:predicted GIY-YIG superfamily endonuclease
MYRIDTYDFSKGDFNKWEIANDYPAVYILENGKIAYIGETGNVIERATQHSENRTMKKYKFKNMHVITGEKSQKSATRHFETLLIRLMIADQKFSVIRDKDKNNKHWYSDKNISELHFDKLWAVLEEKGLVNVKDFHLVMNSNTYKYCPHTDLTKEQRAALTSIINVLDSDETLPHEPAFKQRPILINGEAGTGKTLVATSLFYYL